MNGQIPEWFIELREKVWQRLHTFIGQRMDQTKCRELEEEVNQIIEETERLGVPITNQGRPVSFIKIRLNPLGKPEIKLY